MIEVRVLIHPLLALLLLVPGWLPPVDLPEWQSRQSMALPLLEQVRLEGSDVENSLLEEGHRLLSSLWSWLGC